MNSRKRAFFAVIFAFFVFLVLIPALLAAKNSIKDLPPELLRKGRFDEIFFIDLPKEEERKTIFEIHLKKRRRNPAQFDLNQLTRAADGFNGAEIETKHLSSPGSLTPPPTATVAVLVVETAEQVPQHGGN